MHSPMCIRMTNKRILLSYFGRAQNEAQRRPEQHRDRVARRRAERTEVHPAGIGPKKQRSPTTCPRALEWSGAGVVRSGKHVEKSWPMTSVCQETSPS
ncbi:hypothetical protein DL763_003101 [Monosporascus cannonballus]|nr:hypothetical protein DL763_003101 [Monosporascus cannonballus]